MPPKRQADSEPAAAKRPSFKKLKAKDDDNAYVNPRNTGSGSDQDDSNDKKDARGAVVDDLPKARKAKKAMPDADPDSESDDWVPWMQRHGDEAMDEYVKVVAKTEGSSSWFDEQIKVLQLLYLRGHHPIFPGCWEYNFLMWGFPRVLYRPAGSKKAVAIHNKGDEFRASKALEVLLELTTLAVSNDYGGKPKRAHEIIVRALRKYVKWSLSDAGVAQKKTIPVVQIYHYDKDFGQPKHGPDGDDDGDDDGDGDDSDSDSDGDKDGYGDGDDDDEEEDKRYKFIQADIEQRLQRLARRHRRHLAKDDEESGWRYLPPVLYGYAVIGITVVILCLDASDPTANVCAVEQLRLSTPHDWMWNALTLALPIHMARDHLHEVRDLIKDKKGKMAQRDPDW